MFSTETTETVDNAA
uniref:Uncharacterized protein n=1 Tax=Anguilla anguilla TaxID=7936 RepID=A0A0E9PF67_ANGAN